jgi:TonB family protein
LSQAQEFYLKAVSVLGDRADAVPALIGLGVEALIRKEQGQATEYFKKAQLLDPARAGAAMMWMAVVRHQQNNTSEAESLFKGALAVQDVNSVDAAVTMDLYATFLRVENRADEALAMQERSAAIRKSYMSKNAPAAAATVHKIGGGVTPPSLVFKVEPAYSEEARVAKFQGTSVLSVEIGPDGIARNTRIVRWLGLGLDEKAIEAISRWRFKPGMKDGQPVTVSATIEVNFRLL